MKTDLLRFALAATLWLPGFAAAAPDDDDPDRGQSRLLAFEKYEASEGTLHAGTVRATDDYGYTVDRDFRLSVSGKRENGDRKVVLNRYDPACFDLADAARLPVDAFCDQLTLTYRDGLAEIAFSSVDANRRYRIELSGGPNDFASLKPDVPAPSFSLRTTRIDDGIEYRWNMVTHRAEHAQRGRISADRMGEADLTELEASLIGLAEMLSTFNSYEFQYTDLPRDHPMHAPTPYALWAEQPLDGGCFLGLCFGGGFGGGGAAGDPCSPTSVNYNPAHCQPDLTIARWPLSLRPKLQKIDDDTVRPIYFVKNAGKSDFSLATSHANSEHFVFLSLTRIGSGAPLVPSSIATSDLYGDCFRFEDASFFNPFGLYQMSVDIPAGGHIPNALPPLYCRWRDEGRYRLYMHVDPDATFDSPGYTGNNEATSIGWVRLR